MFLSNELGQGQKMMNDLERTLLTTQYHDCNDIQKVAGPGRIL